MSAVQPRITAQAHQLLSALLEPGDIAVDATCGNGKDTLLLAQLCGSAGTVFACDIQKTALQNTSDALRNAGLDRQVALIHGCHSQWDSLLPPQHKGRIRTFVYNLGYLPRGDKNLTTASTTTLQSLDCAVDWLRPDGALLVVAYPGHPAGLLEFHAVQAWFERQRDMGWVVTRFHSAGVAQRGPELFWAVPANG
ncbi:MAG: hypothetical protein LR015_06400 [Verrucomicrobia bacterium]|nr:hypothetical protein [Verrucomicrobiota bacterium]